jgi:hypothetical protein
MSLSQVLQVFRIQYVDISQYFAIFGLVHMWQPCTAAGLRAELHLAKCSRNQVFHLFTIHTPPIASPAATGYGPDCDKCERSPPPVDSDQMRLDRRAMLGKGSASMASFATVPMLVWSKANKAAKTDKVTLRCQDQPKNGKTCADCWAMSQVRSRPRDVQGDRATDQRKRLVHGVLAKAKAYKYKNGK